MDDMIEAGPELEGQFLDAGPPPEADETLEAAEPPFLEPLPREEVERRWRQTQGALRSSRSDLKAMRAELADLRAAASPEPAGPPDPEMDPMGAVQWMHGQFMAAQEQAAVTDFVSSVESQEAELVQTYPDYHQAVDFLREARRMELVEMGAADEDADRIVTDEFVAGIADARRQGLNPARIAYKLAQDRGYARRGRLGAIEAGAAASRTLSGAGGRGGMDGGSLEARIANLSGPALRDAWKRYKAQAL